MTLVNNKFENKNLHRFSHQAMATTFEIVIQFDDKEYAEQAATAAFEEIDRLEEELSRFEPNSEVTRINKLTIGEELQLSADIFECLKSANHIYKITNGLFDITSGQIIDHWKSQKQSTNSLLEDFNSRKIGMDKIILDEASHSLNILSDELIIDLGGFGKGYAIDKACELLHDWDIENALLHSGGSTVKVIGKLTGYNGWPISISNPSNPTQTIAEIILTNTSLSGSGKQKGSHIINPKTGKPIIERAGAWAMTKSAAQSDAMSTTFMIMSIEKIHHLCNTHNYISGLVIQNDTKEIVNENIYISSNFQL
ncbi:MAG: FAD:protein FMN transferase [Melioribacteraceae bacterium]